MLVGEAMTPDPVTVASGEKLDQVEARMRDGGFRRVPVVDDGVLTGIVSASDLGPHRGHLAETLVSAAMTEPVLTIDADVPLERAARLMIDRKIGGLPVLRDGALAGIVTTTDVIRVFLASLGAAESGVARVDVLIERGQNDVTRLAGAVASAGGEVLALGTHTLSGDDRPLCFVRFRAEDPAAVAESLVQSGYRVAHLHKGD